MAVKKVARPIIHLLDRTFANEFNIEDLMCGTPLGELQQDHIVVDPADPRMPATCETAEVEGRMCPGCRRCAAYFAKGIYVGGLQERQRRAEGMEMLSTRDN